MSNSYDHCKTSVRKFGGKPKDYIDIHEFLDSSKEYFGDARHRMLFHHAAGPWICQKVFGYEITNSDGKTVNVREIAEIHIVEDLGYIPSFAEWAEHTNLVPWMGGKRNKFIGREDMLNQIMKKGKE